MSIFKEFNENGEELKTEKHSNADNLSIYLQENGFEYAKGYLAALNDMSNQLYNALYKNIEGFHVELTPYHAKKNGLRLFQNNEEVIRIVEKALLDLKKVDTDLKP